MELILYFMRMEDKYWGLFLVALVLFFVLFLQKKDGEKSDARKYLFFAAYGIAAYLLFRCPLLYSFIQKFVPKITRYYDLSHVQLVVPALAVAGTAVVLWARKEGRGRAAGLLVGLFVLCVIAGDLAYMPALPLEWDAEVDSEEKEAFDILLMHAKENDTDEKIRIWGMEEFMAKSRLYNDEFCPLYGKDMRGTPENYDETLRNMYSEYALYDIQSGTAQNIKDQIDKLAKLPYEAEGTDCEYMILRDPEKLFEDYDEYCDAGYNVTEQITDYGYEFVGRTENLLLFYRREG